MMPLKKIIKKLIMNDALPVRYDIGLSGIGVGFEYFLQNGLLDTSESNIFEDFDDRMYRAVMYDPYYDLSLPGGLTGWGRYFIYRLNGFDNKHDKLHEAATHIANELLLKIIKKEVPENEQPDVYRFFYDLTKIAGYADKYSHLLHACNKWKCINNPDIHKIFSYMGNLQRLYACQNYFNVELTEEIALEWKKWDNSGNYSLTDTGLLQGWTSHALLHATFSDRHNISWINLL